MLILSARSIQSIMAYLQMLLLQRVGTLRTHTMVAILGICARFLPPSYSTMQQLNLDTKAPSPSIRHLSRFSSRFSQKQLLGQSKHQLSMVREVPGIGAHGVAGATRLQGDILGAGLLGSLIVPTLSLLRTRTSMTSYPR